MVGAGDLGCAVVISHDRWFLDRIATHIMAFEGNGQVPINVIACALLLLLVNCQHIMHVVLHGAQFSLVGFL